MTQLLSGSQLLRKLTCRSWERALFVVQNVAWHYSVIRGIRCYRYGVVFKVGFRVSMAASLSRRQESGMSARCDDVYCAW